MARGPRPLLLRYLPRYSPEQTRRHEVKPRLTGWAQIHGRNAASWETKFELDVWYSSAASTIASFDSLVSRSGWRSSKLSVYVNVTANSLAAS